MLCLSGCEKSYSVLNTQQIKHFQAYLNILNAQSGLDKIYRRAGVKQFAKKKL